MAAVFIYLLLVAGIVYFISSRKNLGCRVFPGAFQSKGFHQRPVPEEVWKQVYETASMDEARLIRTRLAEEGIECVLYEQGKRGIHGNLLAGIGLATPATVVEKAQSIIAKIPA